MDIQLQYITKLEKLMNTVTEQNVYIQWFPRCETGWEDLTLLLKFAILI